MNNFKISKRLRSDKPTESPSNPLNFPSSDSHSFWKYRFYHSFQCSISLVFCWVTTGAECGIKTVGITLRDIFRQPPLPWDWVFLCTLQHRKVAINSDKWAVRGQAMKWRDLDTDNMDGWNISGDIFQRSGFLNKHCRHLMPCREP